MFYFTCELFFYFVCDSHNKYIHLLRDGMADDDADGRLSQLSNEQLQNVANWSLQSGVSGSEVDVLHVLGVRAAIVAVYVVIIIVGVIGNGLVVVVAASRTPRSPSTARTSLQVRSETKQESN